jgi:DNA mismatch repair protein MutS
MPKSVVTRAQKILRDLEASHSQGAIGTKDALPRAPKAGDLQMSIFQLEDPVLKQVRDEIRDLDVNHLTPLEALNKLSEIKKITGL